MTEDEEKKKLSEAAKLLSDLGASKGGKARAEQLTAKERQEIARRGAAERWKGKKKLK